MHNPHFLNIKYNKILSIIYLMLIFFGIFISYFFNQGSYSYSLIFVIMLSLFNSFKPFLLFKGKYFVYIFFGIIFLYLISMIIYNNSNSLRFFASLILLFGTYIGSVYSYFYLDKIPDKLFHKVLVFVFIVFLLISLFSLYRKYFLFSTEKEIFLFLEPSHYAIFVLPFIAYFSNKSKFINSIILTLYFLVYSVLIQNVTLFIGVLFVIFLKLKFYILFLLLILIPVLFYSQDFSQYLIDRFYFLTDSSGTKDISNLSLLVFLSSYERLFLNLKDSFLFGVGFQQLGFNGINGFYLNRISFIMNGTYLNLYDGGTLLAKLISEFGLFGILFVFLYLIHFFFLIFTDRFSIFISPKFDLFKFYFLLLIIQLFVRGIGYFSPYLFFLFIYFHFFTYGFKRNEVIIN